MWVKSGGGEGGWPHALPLVRKCCLMQVAFVETPEVSNQHNLFIPGPKNQEFSQNKNTMDCHSQIDFLQHFYQTAVSLPCYGSQSEIRVLFQVTFHSI